MLTYDPSKPAKYPNGRVFTDDVIDYRLAFLTKGECPPSGLSPHTDTLDEFPYLGRRTDRPSRAYGLMRILPGEYSPLWVAVPRSSCAGVASTMVSNLRSEPQSRPQSCDR